MQLYDTLSKTKSPLTLIKEKHIGLYVCGMTVYDYCHIGHARVMLAFDMMVRFWRAQGYSVKYVRNITDIDDKIIKRAAENNETVEALTERFITALFEDEKALEIVAPDMVPRATDYMPNIILLIEKILEHHCAYVGDNGDVYFAVNAMQDYGKLSKQDLSKLRSGCRVEVASAKKEALDFVLWKHAKVGEPSWDSPWGAGRPGWHIECSAMSMDCLGETFDIHGGGPDLVFPHHENEIAQSEAATHKPFANVWLHAGPLLVKDEKMSKSIGNILSIRDLLTQYSVEVLRYFMLSVHYRSPLNYTPMAMLSAHSACQRLYQSLRGLTLDEENLPETENFTTRFNAVMEDDFNTPEAFAVLFEMSHEINRLRDAGDETQAASLGCLLKQLAAPFGICQQSPEIFLQSGLDSETIEHIENLIIARDKARSEKNWAKADEVRDQLTAMDIALEDSPIGTRWRSLK